MRLSNAQRRHAETLGWTRTARDVTPDLRQYIEQKSQVEAGGAARAGPLPLL